MFASSLTTYNPPPQTDINYQTKDTGLSDYPFKNVVVCANATWNNFDQAICQIGKDIRWNRGERGIYSEQRLDTIETVLNMYRNLVVNDSTLYQYTDEPQNERERDAILELLKIIAERSGVQYDQVVEIMKTLYWGVHDARVRSSDALYPREAVINNTDRGASGSGGSTDTLGTLVKWGIPILIGGGILYGITKLVTLTTLVKAGVADSEEVTANNEGE